MTINVLDCTLRDGGYYNSWDFDADILKAYLDAAAEAKLDYVELGFRRFPQEGFLGAFAYTTEIFLNSIHLPTGPIYGVMVDANTILSSEFEVEEAIERLFVPKKKSKISLVRVASHFNEVEKSGPIVKKLKEMGYVVAYNLMQSGGKSNEIITDKARQAKNWNVLDVLYFADSLGNMDGAEVERIVGALRQGWDGPLGIHTHNNMGKGLDNTLTALNAGVTWLDTTITGMGRGAGNTPTENLLAVQDKLGCKYSPQPIYNVVIRYFEPMQKEYGWGSSLLYFLGAQNDVHPTYIQTLLSSTHFGKDEIVGAISYLSTLEDTTSYNGSVLDTAVSFNSTSNKVIGTDSLVNKFKGKEVLVIANGETTKQYKDAVELYIQEMKPIVLSLNLVENINCELVDYCILSHNVKFLADFKHYNNLSSPVVLPKHRFSEEELVAINNLEIFDVGFNTASSHLTFELTHVNAPYDLTSAYMLGLLAMAAPSKVNMVGFDGYDKGDIRQQEMLDILQQYQNIPGTAKLTSLTPTSYPLKQGSIYAIHS